MGTLADPGVMEHLPVVIGIGVLVIGGIIGVLRGYRWFLSEIKRVITEAIDNHAAIEKAWQTEVERRLGAIEEKVDRLIAGNK